MMGCLPKTLLSAAEFLAWQGGRAESAISAFWLYQGRWLYFIFLRVRALLFLNERYFLASSLLALGGLSR